VSDRPPVDEPILGRVLLIAAIVGVTLVGIKLWLEPKHAGPPELDEEITGQGPDLFGYAPVPGRWMQDIRASDGSHVLVPVDISELGEGRVQLETPWRPPEPDLFGTPPPLQDHAQHIRMVITIASTGHVEDVVGPDDYLETIDEDQPTAADTIRDLGLEEQTDEVLRWQVTGFMASPAVEGSRSSTAANLPGLGPWPDWSGTVDYTVGATAGCPEHADEADEECVTVRLASRPEPDGRTELTGELVIGRQTGMEWAAELTRDAGERSRTVHRKLIRPEDAPVPTP